MDSASVYGELVNFDKTAKAPVDIYNEALSSLGISDARTRVNTLRGELTNTEGLLKNVEGNVSQRTSNALVTEAQRQKLVTSERQPLVEQTDILGRNLTNATSNVNDIENQAKTKADLTFTGQQAQRGAIESRYNAAVGKEKAAEAKRQWEAEQAEKTRQFNEQMALQRQQESRYASSAVDGQADFLNYIKNQWASVGGAGKYGASRQQQDAWANAWFAANGINNTAARQYYWDLFNKTYNRPADPTKDWLYKR
jgi:hypothetical protein